MVTQKRQRYDVRHTVEGRGDTVYTAKILANDSAEAMRHAQSHIVNIGKVIDVKPSPKGARKKGLPRW